VTAEPLSIGIVGCGDIARIYAAAIAASQDLVLVAASDRNADRAQALTAAYGGTPYTSFDDLLADPRVGLVVNLTRHYSHAELTGRALAAGRHIFSEKPLAMTGPAAWALVELASRSGVRLGCAPATYLGESQQTAWAAVRTGLLGRVRVVFADVNWGQIERWHPRPQDFYAAGALFDVGVYPLSVLTAFFGPVRSVTATASIVQPDRQAADGSRFTLAAPDFAVAMLRLQSGPLVRLTCGFYVDTVSRQRGIEIHGDEGSLLMDRWYEFGSGVHAARRGAAAVRVPLLGTAPDIPVDYGRALSDLAQAIRSGEPHRATGEHAAHVVDVIEATLESARSGRPADVQSTFAPPAPGAPGLLIPPDDVIREQLGDLLDHGTEQAAHRDPTEGN
jgi:predicted dehydrogenase